MMFTKPVVITGVVTSLLCSLHFFSMVYVPVKDEQRLLAVQALPVSTFVLPYQPEQLQSTIALWRLPAIDGAGNAADAENGTPLLAGFDNTMLGDTTVALLGIYQQQQPVAVLALQQSGQSVNYVRLALGDSSGDIQLSQVNRRDITLSYNGKQVKLQLFTPASAVTE